MESMKAASALGIGCDDTYIIDGQCVDDDDEDSNTEVVLIMKRAKSDGRLEYNAMSVG